MVLTIGGRALQLTVHQRECNEEEAKRNTQRLDVLYGVAGDQARAGAAETAAATEEPSAKRQDRTNESLFSDNEDDEDA